VLLRLFNFWFPIFGLFFAAGATIDAGIGGGDGAGDSGADSGSSGDDAASDDTDVSDADEEGIEAVSEGDDGLSETTDTDPNAPVNLGDGRTVPAKWKKAFDLAKQAGVEKEVKQLYYAQQRLTKAIPGGVNAAIQLAQDVEEMGGLEGVQQLQEEVATHRADGQLFENDQRKWVEQAFTESPEHALKAFGHSLAYIAEHYPDDYSYHMAQVIISDLKSSSPVGKLHRFLLSQEDNAEAQQLAKELADYYHSREDAAKTAPEKKPDAQSKALTDRETTIKKQEMDLRYKQVNNEAFPALKSEVTKVLRSEAKANGLDLDRLSKEYPAEWRNMLNEIHQDIMRAAIKDTRFLNKYAALVEKNQLDRAAQAINAKHAQLAPESTRKIMGTYGVFRGKKNIKPGGDKDNQPGNRSGEEAQNQGWTRVAKRPENSSIDWSKTTQRMQLDGQYILNDGKKVVVKY
jgi:hypothetical protein